MLPFICIFCLNNHIKSHPECVINHMLYDYEYYNYLNVLTDNFSRKNAFKG